MYASNNAVTLPPLLDYENTTIGQAFAAKKEGSSSLRAQLFWAPRDEAREGSSGESVWAPRRA